jgi:cystathionine beta-lyase/cystathionine gamma-synthase
VRLSVGIEVTQDIIANLEQALARTVPASLGAERCG